MKIPFSDSLTAFAKQLNYPLYAVGGYVRNYLICQKISSDIDICAPVEPQQFLRALKGFSFEIKAEYKRTGTVVFSDGQSDYEFTPFRKEQYTKGNHTPCAIEFTTDIVSDALRRDFKCNAIYYDIARGELVDPLGGINDVRRGIIDTVQSPEKVFCFDGLRLMRLARFAGELNFKPTENVLAMAKSYSFNIKDISPERIYAELKKILVADTAYSFSDKAGHYEGLKILEQIGVLDYIMPELTLGRAMAQRADFHKYDVLGHSLRAVLYADKSVRLGALLHDVGKPYSMNLLGNYKNHATYGEPLAREILKRLRADNATIERVCAIVKNHMFDYNGKEKIDTVKLFIVRNIDILGDLLFIRQADYSAGMDKDGECPEVIKWKNIYSQMLADGAPLRLNELAINGLDLAELGVKGKQIGKVLNAVFEFAVINAGVNEKSVLLKKAKEIMANC